MWRRRRIQKVEGEKNYPLRNGSDGLIASEPTPLNPPRRLDERQVGAARTKPRRQDGRKRKWRGGAGRGSAGPRPEAEASSQAGLKFRQLLAEVNYYPWRSLFGTHAHDRAPHPSPAPLSKGLRWSAMEPSRAGGELALIRLVQTSFQSRLLMSFPL